MIELQRVNRSVYQIGEPRYKLFYRLSPIRLPKIVEELCSTRCASGLIIEALSIILRFLWTAPRDITELKNAIRFTHGCESLHVESVPVKEIFDGETAWEGTVEVFELVGHQSAKRAYAWILP
jgi:hypothetical protein